MKKNTEEKDGISIEAIDSLYEQYEKDLTDLEPFIYLKLYNRIKEKFNNEKEQFAKLLNWQDARDEALSRYSFVLNSQYFEQKFFNRLHE
jgi:hypothetical protein